VVFACQTKDDTCAGSGDCNPSLGTGGSSSAGGAGGAGGAGCLSDGGCIARMCSFVPAVSDGGPDAGQKGSHQCTPVRPCGTGRPFLVGGAARVADVARRSDWSSSIAPCLDGLDEAARDALAVHWTDVGLMEHASIAAFARFALELLSLGAPPALLVETQAALADETVHARDAFALASAYAGCHVGPGALQIDCALSARDPLEIVRTAILEGCIGETVAAVEATEALAHATDPAVRAALERVARDETRHAELAWRFIRWAVTSGSPAFAHSTRNALTSVVRSEIAAAERLATGAETPRAELLAHGALDSATRRDLRRRVLVEIIEPCARALAESRESAGPSAVMVA
jgi:hypothetical protein